MQTLTRPGAGCDVRFTIVGQDPVVVAIEGVWKDSAATSLDAIVDWLVSCPEVAFEVTACDLGAHGGVEIAGAMDRIVAAGGRATLSQPTLR